MNLADNDVLRCGQVDMQSLSSLLARYGLELELVEQASDITGSYWGDSEAGLIGNRVIASPETPVHSVLHELCHYICMDDTRRATLDTDAGGDHLEECGVCYLQILLADQVPEMYRARMFADMDRWGYSFRLGSAQAWFDEDSGDAAAWLRESRLIDRVGRPTWNLR